MRRKRRNEIQSAPTEARPTDGDQVEYHRDHVSHTCMLSTAVHPPSPPRPRSKEVRRTHESAIQPDSDHKEVLSAIQSQVKIHLGFSASYTPFLDNHCPLIVLVG